MTASQMRPILHYARTLVTYSIKHPHVADVETPRFVDCKLMTASQMLPIIITVTLKRPRVVDVASISAPVISSDFSK